MASDRTNRLNPSAFRALIGAVAWAGCYLWFQPPWELAMLWLGALVHVPLAMGLIQPGPGKSRPDQLLKLAARLQLPAALCLVASFQPEVRGIWLALPWIAVTGLCGVAGAWRAVARGVRRTDAIADCGLVLFAISGAWAGAAAMEWAVFGFPLLIGLLASVHQLYAGLVLQVVASRIVAWRPGRLPLIAAICVSVGNPLVATGITLSHAGAPVAFEFGFVLFYACAVIVLGWCQLFLALWPKSGLPLAARVLLVLSDLAMGTAMTLAIIFAWGTLRGVPTLTIPEMTPWHGTLNAVGFGLCALVGWNIAAKHRPTC
ncbi:MAG: YndJ family transporter [Planctomycetes bacterium]|nr:YndJ family transporter [Planctomycetota bacterium]